MKINPALDETPPSWEHAPAPAPNMIVARVSAAPPSGPGIMPTLLPVFLSSDESYLRWRTTNVRPQKQFGFVTATAKLRRAFDRPSARIVVVTANASIELACDAADRGFVADVGRGRRPPRSLPAPRGGEPRLAEASTVADVTSCPGAESCRLAVTQSRGLGRLLEEQLRARPDLIAKADGAHIKISGCPNGCGQHHIATIGFQGSVRRVGGKAVPQYFVMVGGAATERGASFARTAAKVPARRIPETLERLIDFYHREKDEGESAPSFFQRVDIQRVHGEIADLQNLTEADATPEDFVDLAETAEFAPEVMDGECSA